MSLRPADAAPPREASPRAGALDGLFRFEELSLLDTDAVGDKRPLEDERIETLRRMKKDGAILMNRTANGELVIERVLMYFDSTRSVPYIARAFGFKFDDVKKIWRRYPGEFGVAAVPQEMLDLFDYPSGYNQQQALRRRREQLEKDMDIATIKALAFRNSYSTEYIKTLFAEAVNKKLGNTATQFSEKSPYDWSNVITEGEKLFKFDMEIRITAGVTPNVGVVLRKYFVVDKNMFQRSERARNYFKSLGFRYDPNKSKMRQEQLDNYLLWYVEDNQEFFHLLNLKLESEVAKLNELEKKKMKWNPFRPGATEAPEVYAAVEWAKKYYEREQAQAIKLQQEYEAREKARREAAEAAKTQREQEQRRKDELDKLVKDIDSGIVPTSALDSLTPEERTSIMTELIRRSMARDKASSKADVRNIEFADESLFKLFFRMLQILADSFKAIERKVEAEHRLRFGPNDEFKSVADSHSRGLNTYGIDAFGSWPFGYYKLYVRITASGKGRIEWSAAFSKMPFDRNVGQGGMRDNEQRLQVEQAMKQEYNYKSPIIRNSGTLYIALNALWKGADDDTRQAVRACRPERDVPDPEVQERDMVNAPGQTDP
jgi:hypothetical protein